MTSTKLGAMEAACSEWEHKHSLRCLWSQVIGNRTIQVECFWWPQGNCTVMATKHYDHPLPKNSYKKPFPKMVGHYAYFPLDNGTWDNLNETMATIKPQYTEEEIHTA